MSPRRYPVRLRTVSPQRLSGAGCGSLWGVFPWSKSSRRARAHVNEGWARVEAAYQAKRATR